MADKKKTILLIEDESALREAIRVKVEKEGIELWMAETGEQGLAVLKEKKPDLIWLDILLPGMNGLEVLKRIREDKKTKDQPVIVISVSAGQEKIKQAFNLGVIDYLIKSEYTLDEIVRKVKEILKNL